MEKAALMLVLSFFCLLFSFCYVTTIDVEFLCESTIRYGFYSTNLFLILFIFLFLNWIDLSSFKYERIWPKNDFVKDKA